MKCEIFSYLKKANPYFDAYSPTAQKKIVDEVFKRSKNLSIDQTHSLIKKIILSKAGASIAPPLDHPLGKAFSSLLLAESDWHEKIPSLQKVFSFLPSILWKTDPNLSKAARNWLQAKIQHSAEEIPDKKMRSIYLRNLLAYYPFFSPKKDEEIRLPFGPLESTLSYRVEPIELTPPYLGSPLMAYGLIPKTAKASPLLLFKGTTYPADNGFYLSLLTDINPLGAVGSFAFQRFGKGKIESWLAKQAQEHDKVEVLGASLGGSLSLQTAATYPKYIKSVHAFNSPGVSFEEVALWGKSEEKPEVNVYLQEGDPISSFVGRCFACDWKIHQVFVPKISSAQVHASTYTAHPEVFIIPEDATTVNRDIRRRFWPFIQNVVLFPPFLLGSAYLLLKVQSFHVRSFTRKMFTPKAS